MNQFKIDHPKAFAALKTALVVFVAQFVPDLLGFIGDIREWATGTDVVFPALEPLGKAFVAACSAAVAGAANFAYNAIRPASAPVYSPKGT